MNFIARSLAVATNLLTFGALSKEYERAFYEGAKSTRLNSEYTVSNNHFVLQVEAIREML